MVPSLCLSSSFTLTFAFMPGGILQGMSHRAGSFIDLQFDLDLFQVTSSTEQFAVFVEDWMNLKVFVLHNDVLEIDLQNIKGC